jgi:hypothetical protein
MDTMTLYPNSIGRVTNLGSDDTCEKFQEYLNFLRHVFVARINGIKANITQPAQNVKLELI